MSLRDIVIGGATIDVGDSKVELHGLSLESLATLMQDHKDALISLFGDGNPDWVSMMAEFSEFISVMIALSAGEPEAADAVKKWPTGVQLVALEAIWEETAIDTDSLGKLLEGFIKGVEKTTSKLPELNVSNSGLKTSKG